MNEKNPSAVALARIDDALESISTDFTARLAQVRSDVADLRDLPLGDSDALRDSAARDLDTQEPAVAPAAPLVEPVEANPYPAVAPQQPVAPPQQPMAPQPQLQYATQPQFAPPHVQPGYPAPGQPIPQQWMPPAPRTPEERQNLISKVLAIAGVGVTLIGVVLLLVMAAQAGLLRPEIRVAGGALLAMGLFGAGLRVGRRRERRTGAIGLVATGVAAGRVDVQAAPPIYHWLPGIGALILGSVVAAGGLAVARLWDNQALGVTVGVALLVLAPVLTEGVNLTLIIFLLVYAAATLAVQVTRDWPAMYAVNTVATTLPILTLTAFGSKVDAVQFGAVAAVSVVLALVSAVVLLRSSTKAPLLAGFSLIPVLPLIVSNQILDRPSTAGLLGTTAVALAALAIGGRILESRTASSSNALFTARVIWLAGAVVAAIAAIVLASDGGNGTILGLLGLALVLSAAVRFADDLSQPTLIAATGATVVGLLSLLAPGSEQLVSASGLTSDQRITVFFGSLMGMASVAAIAWTWMQRSTENRTFIAVSAGIASLALFNVACVSFGAMVTGGAAAGFRAGHMVATIGFVAAGAAALLWARRLRGSGRTLAMTAGLVVIGAAVAKLFLFDLAALDGVFRAIAFIVVGLVLLGLGVAYAQSLPDDEEVPAAPPVPPMPGQQPMNPVG